MPEVTAKESLGSIKVGVMPRALSEAPTPNKNALTPKPHSVAEKGKAKEKSIRLAKLKGCYRLLITPGLPAPELEEKSSEFGDVDYNTLSVAMLRAEQLEEEELDRALKASI